LKERERLKERRAISPVISVIMLSVVVLAVGGAIWSFSQGAMTITAEDYVEAMVNMTDTISERFIVENVVYDTTTDILSIWVFNYGDVDIVVDVYAEVDEGESGSRKNYEIPSGAFKTAEINEITLVNSSGKEVAIKIVSRRGNNAFYRYVMP